MGTIRAPGGHPVTIYRYSLDTFHTDEGIEGHTMQNSNASDGGEMALGMTNCGWAEGHNPIFSRGVLGDPLAIVAEGYRHLAPGPGLGVEIDWDFIDNVTESIIRTPAH